MLVPFYSARLGQLQVIQRQRTLPELLQPLVSQPGDVVITVQNEHFLGVERLGKRKVEGIYWASVPRGKNQGRPWHVLLF